MVKKTRLMRLPVLKAIGVTLSFLTAALMLAGCGTNAKVGREEFSGILSRTCRVKYQAHIVTKAVDETIWVYLPYFPGRYGVAKVQEKNNNLYIDHEIASFNPYRKTEPAELKFVTQKILVEIRKLLIRCDSPYKFFVLVITDIASLQAGYEDWYMGYINDVLHYGVGMDFAGEGYNRLVWHSEKVEVVDDGSGPARPASYLDETGRHIRYHDITLGEFIQRQIEWRIYKRFTIDYTRVPYDLTALEKQEEVINIVKKVLLAYNFSGYDKFYLRDRFPVKEEPPKMFRDYSGLEKETERLGLDRDSGLKLRKAAQERLLTDMQEPYYIGGLLKNLERYQAGEVKRRPAF